MQDLSVALREFRNPRYVPKDPPDVYIADTIAQDDPRAGSPEVIAAQKEEIKSLIGRGTFKVISTEKLPSNTNILLGRFVLDIKSTDD